MATQKWHEKASVQSALVNIIPALLVSIAAIGIQTCYSERQLAQNADLNKKQLEQNAELANKQNKRDSLLNAAQLQLTRLQIDISKREFLTDSLLQSQSLIVSKNQLKLSYDELHSKEATNKLKLVAALNKLHMFPRPHNKGTTEWTKEDRIAWATHALDIIAPEMENPIISANKNLYFRMKMILDQLNAVIIFVDKTTPADKSDNAIFDAAFVTAHEQLFYIVSEVEPKIPIIKKTSFSK